MKELPRVLFPTTRRKAEGVKCPLAYSILCWESRCYLDRQSVAVAITTGQYKFTPLR